jgi:hypothetical protein
MIDLWTYVVLAQKDLGVIPNKLRNKTRQLLGQIDFFLFQCDSYLSNYYTILDFYFELIASKKEIAYDFQNQVVIAPALKYRIVKKLRKI